MNVKILFPTGYQVNDIYNDNLDVQIILSNGKVYFTTVFTVANIDYLMKRDNDIFFLAPDILIVKDLKKETIRDSIVKIVAEDYTEEIFSYIGTIDKVYKARYNYRSFEDVVDMTK